MARRWEMPVDRGAVLLALAAAGVLRAFFVAVRTQWPLAYFELGSAIDPILRRSVSRYAIFRAGPVFLCGLFVAVTVERWQLNGTSAVLLMTATHLATGYGLAIARTLRARQIRTRIASFWIGSSLLVIAAAAAAIWLADAAEPVVPPPTEMVTALWTGMFATAVAVAVIRTISDPQPYEIETLLQRSESEIPERLQAILKEKCLEFDADPALVHAVMLVENLQRPKWLRRLEALKGRLFGRGTYGIMQVSSDQPINDAASIARAIESFFAGTRQKPAESWLDHHNRVLQAVERYNSNPAFVEMAQRALNTPGMI